MSQCFLYNDCNHKFCDVICQRKLKLAYLLETAELPESKWTDIKLVIDADQTDYNEFSRLAEIKNKMVTFVKTGKNLFLHSSNSGNGKTSWSIKLALNYLDKTWKSYDFDDCAVLFISVPRLVEAIKRNRNFNTPDSYARRMRELSKKADLVIWDDVATKSSSDTEINELLDLIEYRIFDGKANIFTSNLNYEQICGTLGSRLASRICNSSIDIELHGADKRRLQVDEF